MMQRKLMSLRPMFQVRTQWWRQLAASLHVLHVEYALLFHARFAPSGRGAVGAVYVNKSLTPAAISTCLNTFARPLCYPVMLRAHPYMQ